MIKYPFTTIYPSAKIGKETTIGNYCEIGRNVIIGENCSIQAFVFMPEGVEIGNNVFVGPGTIFTNDKKPPSFGEYWAKTIVEDGVVIGAHCTILPGIKISKKSIIGAGSIVTKNISEGELWYNKYPAEKMSYDINI